MYSRTARTPLYLPVHVLPPYSLPLFFLLGTSARDRRALQQLALNVHVKHSDLTWPIVFAGKGEVIFKNKFFNLNFKYLTIHIFIKRNIGIGHNVRR